MNQKHGLKKQYPSEYNLWRDIKKRASVSDDWKNNFPNFLNDIQQLGYQKGLNCIRIDDTLEFSKDNCQFVSRAELSRLVKNKYGSSISDKRKQTCLKRYGYEHPSQSPTIKQKVKNTCLKNYGVPYGVNKPDSLNKALKAKEELGLITLYDGKTYAQIHRENQTNKAYSTFIRQKNKWGLEYALSKAKWMSNLPSTVTIWLDNIGIVYQTEFCVGDEAGRANNYYADIYCPDHKLIIECDGLYWHSDAILDNKYHIKKRQQYTEYGYTPLFFREDELQHKIEIVKSIILARCGLLTNKCFARQTTLKTVGKQEARQFFEDNHLMGGVGQGGRSIGLFYNNNLLSCLRYKKKYDGWEIDRFCNRIGWSIVGGLSRLIKQLGDKTITSFVDLRYGNGHSLSKIGFELVSTYASFRWCDRKQTFHRYKFPRNTGYDKGLWKIWDCGQAKFIRPRLK